MQVFIFNGPQEHDPDDDFACDGTILEVEEFTPAAVREAMLARDWHMPHGRFFFAARQDFQPGQTRGAGFLLRALNAPTAEVVR